MKAQGSSVLRRQSAQGMAARDRRAAAVHEAGHLIIARHLGMMNGWATIFPTEAGTLLNKAWLGNFSYSLAELDELTIEDRAMFAVAGMVAEAAWSEGLSEEAICWPDVMMDPECMSATDWAETGCSSDDPSDMVLEAAERVAALLSPSTGQLWSNLIRTARRLIREHVTFN